MSGPKQTNVANAVTLRRRSQREQHAHLASCKDCLRGIPPTLGEILDYCPRKDQHFKLRTHFVVFLGREPANGGSSLEARYMCCVITRKPPKLSRNEPQRYYFSLKRGHQRRSDMNLHVTFIPAAPQYQWKWLAGTQVPAFAQPFPLTLLHRVLNEPLQNVRLRLDDGSIHKLICKLSRTPQQIDPKEYCEVEASLCNDE